MKLSIKSFNGLTLNDTNYDAYFPEGALFAQTGADIAEQMRQDAFPLFSAKSRRSRLLPVAVIMLGVFNTQIDELNRYFDAEDTTLRKLIASDGAHDWYLYATLQEVSKMELPEIVFALYVPDPIWRRETETVDIWNVTANGQTKKITLSGNRGAYPIFEVTPTAPHSSATGLAYECFCPIYNPGLKTFIDYPFDVAGAAFDTATLVTAGKMQVDGDDLRVYVDGVEVDRWLSGMNGANTKVWINLGLSAQKEGSIAAAIADAGAITTIDLSSSLDGWPAAGMGMIGAEMFSWTGKDNTSKQLTGVTREIKGSTAAAHSIGDTIRWIEHDITIKYGNSSLSAPVVDSTRQPMINLDTSTNASWDYDEFADTAGLRSGGWSTAHTLYGLIYTANHKSYADPASEMGVNVLRNLPPQAGGGPSWAYWRLYNPAGITAWNFSNGENYNDGTPDMYDARLRSSVDGWTWTDDYAIPAPNSLSTWKTWNDNRATLAIETAYYVQLYTSMSFVADSRTEVADVTVTLDSDGIPQASMLAEISVYQLACRISNNDTGEYINIDFTMSFNETLQIDTEAHTVTYLKDNSNVFNALKPPPARNEWLKLAYGANELQYTEIEVAGVTIVSRYRERNS